LKFTGSNVGYCPVTYSILVPTHHIVSVDHVLSAGGPDIACVRDCRQADDVTTMAIDERWHWSGADHINPCADQRKSRLRKIDHARSLRDPPIEPWLHGVTVGRVDVGGARGHEPAHVRVDCCLADMIVR